MAAPVATAAIAASVISTSTSVPRPRVATTVRADATTAGRPVRVREPPKAAVATAGGRPNGVASTATARSPAPTAATPRCSRA